MKRWSWTEGVLVVICIGVGLILTAIAGLRVYMALTPPLYPDPAKVPSVIRAQPSPEWEGAVERGEQAARAALIARSLPGLSVAVGVRGEIVWAEAFGYADLDGKIAMTPEHRSRIGTASTAFTSAATGLLLEDGRLKLGEEIQTYVPAFPRKEWPVRIGPLLAHTSGVRDYDGDGGLFEVECEHPADGLPVFADMKLGSEPETEYRYSNHGWLLVSAAIEAATAEPFLRFMQEKVFGPARMNGTRVESVLETIPNRATPYYPAFVKFAADTVHGRHETGDGLRFSCLAGAIGFLSTPSDMVRFAIALQNGRLVRSDTLTLLQTSQKLASGAQTNHGLGWDVATVTLSGKQARMVGREGELFGGNVSSLMTLPEFGIVVAVTSNIPLADTASIALKIAEGFATPPT